MKRRNTGPTPAVLAIVHARSGELCEVCGLARADQVHHRLPRRMGGTRRPEVNQPSNLLHIDASCHLAIESSRAASEDCGFLLHERDNPRRERVLYRGELRYLDNKGGFDEPPTCPAGCAMWTSNDNPCDCNAEEA